MSPPTYGPSPAAPAIGFNPFQATPIQSAVQTAFADNPVASYPNNAAGASSTNAPSHGNSTGFVVQPPSDEPFFGMPQAQQAQPLNSVQPYNAAQSYNHYRVQPYNAAQSYNSVQPAQPYSNAQQVTPYSSQQGQYFNSQHGQHYGAQQGAYYSSRPFSGPDDLAWHQAEVNRLLSHPGRHEFWVPHNTSMAVRTTPAGPEGYIGFGSLPPGAIELGQFPVGITTLGTWPYRSQNAPGANAQPTQTYPQDPSITLRF